LNFNIKFQDFITMMNIRKTHLAIAVAGAVGLGASTAHAADFDATATIQNTLTVTNVLDFDLGTVFATVTGAAYTNGVGALVISPTGVLTSPSTSATILLTSLSTPVPAQASVAMTSDFNLVFPVTSTIDVDDFVDDGGTGLIENILSAGVELIHSSGNPTVPSLYLMHFTVGDVSGGVAGADATFTGGFAVEQDFGESTYVFNIGATLTTEPADSGALTYQEGVYSGTFAVTAEY
jgi:hypothetical protein